LSGQGLEAKGNIARWRYSEIRHAQVRGTEQQ